MPAQTSLPPSVASFTYVDACDYVAVPMSGQLTFARQVADEFGADVDLVGISLADEGSATGRWTTRQIGGTQFRYFSLYRHAPVLRPKIPLRVRNFIAALWLGRRLVASARGPLLVNSPELAIALFVATMGRARFAYMFHGTENPLEMPRYRWGKIVARPFERLLFRALRDSPAVLASADDSSIARLERKMGALVPQGGVRTFREVYDDSLFYPEAAPRTEGERYRILCVGRISQRKGWRLLVEAMALALKQPFKRPLELVFVGDGEDRPMLEAAIAELGIGDHVSITGMMSREQVRQHIWGADLVVFGSYYEGWSIAMLEALACGKPVVSTAVSGTETLVDEGVNGFVSASRDPRDFALLLSRASLELPSFTLHSVAKAAPYRRSKLKERLAEIIAGIAK
ncbi:MAG: glycosyltransferase family 4 protein [Devosia sp.]|uniref:glycosyltransferase n=1 Tax=Devosia sp. TaxID=1871048 RepID=UPI001ACD9079|nr:glycosyltransferase [Devosia sp.]MBN9317450.1 glycosyltransferase family 4 protein [Devosia sp.]